MTKYTLLFIVAASILLHNCDENSFSQVVTIEIPEHQPRPLLKLKMEAGEEILSALVSNSKGILDPDSTFKIPDDANVVLYRNGEVFADFSFFEQTLKYEAYLNEGIRNQAGDEYLLEATLPGFDKVSATQVMPKVPVISAATYEPEGTIDETGYRVDELVVDIEDVAPGVTNYFGLRLYQVVVDIDQNGDTIGVYSNNSYLDSTDPLLNYSSSYGLVFTDEGFSNNTYRARCYTYNSVGGNSNVSLQVELFHLTKDAYLFERSLSQYEDAIGNPFAEPVTVHNNIQGGYGVFTLANKTVFVIEP